MGHLYHRRLSNIDRLFLGDETVALVFDVLEFHVGKGCVVEIHPGRKGGQWEAFSRHFQQFRGVLVRKEMLYSFQASSCW